MKSVLLKILLILSFLPFSQVWGADFIPAITNYTVNLWKRRIKRDKCLRNACQ